MTLPITGMVFLFGSFVFLYLSRKFWLTYKSEKNFVAQLFSYSFLSIGIGYLVATPPCMLLVDSPNLWRFVYPLYVFLISVGYLTIISIAARERLRRYFKPILFFLVAVMLIGELAVIISPPSYFFEDGSLNWRASHSMGSLVVVFLLFLLIPTITFFFQEGKKAKDTKAKIRAFGLGIALSDFILSGIIDYFLLNFFHVHPGYSDLNLAVMFSIIALTLIITWGPETEKKEKWVKKIE